MPLISHRKDPAGIEKHVSYEVPDNTNIIDWLTSTFKTQEDLCGNLACSFVLNGKEIFRTDHDSKDESILDIAISNNDQLVIINRPAGIDPFSWVAVTIYVAVASVAVAVYTYMNIPELGDSEGADESPNSKLNAGTNSFRPYQGIPEIFGTGIAYPDFIQPSYYYYENNIKKQVGLFCLTVGQADIAAINVGLTNIESISDSTATIFLPGQTVPADYLSIHTKSTEIDGQVLLAPDDDSVIKRGIKITAISVGTSITRIDVDDSGYVDSTFIDDLGLAVGDYLYIRSGQLVGASSTIVIDGVYEIQSIPSASSPASFIINKTIAEDTYVSLEFFGQYNRTIVGRGWPEGVIGDGTDGEADIYQGWYELAGDEAEEVWANWTMPYGLRKSGGGTATMKVKFDIRSVTSGAIFSKTVSLTKNTADGQYNTVRFTQANTAGMPVDKFEFRASRITNLIDRDGNASEQVQIESVESVKPYSTSSFGDVTLILVERKATLFSADQSSKKINIDYTRKLPTYNRTTGVYDTDTLVATNSFADAAAYTLIVQGDETVDTVDLSELYGIYDGLSDSDLGEFSYTFDDADLSKGERVDNICKVARVVSFHDGNKWRFSRDEAKPIRAALFNRRSTVGNQSAQSWQPQRSDDSDSIRIIYVDPDSNTEAYIDRSFNTDTGVIIEDEVGYNLKEIQLAGCRNITQATNRADLEIRRLAYQRRSVTETTYRDALSIDLLDRVGWVDVNDIDTFDGEIMGINGSTYDTTERFEPVDGESYVVFITDAEGYPSNTVQCLPRTDTEFGFIASGISGAYVAIGDQQIGSRYFIANSTDLTASNFTLTSRKPNNDGTVTIELAEYRSEMYEKDGTTAASSAPLIPSGLTALKVVQSGTSTSTVTFETGGTVDLNGNEAIWYSDGATVGIGASFEVYATLTSGTATGTFNTWLTLDSDRAWSVVDITDDASPVSAVITFTVRQIDYTSSLSKNSINITAVVAEAIAMPASLEVTDSEFTTAIASVTLNSNGTYEASDGTNGTYTTSTDNIGQYYQAYATQTLGEVDGSNVGEWVTLSGSGATWSVTSSTSNLAIIDIEVREIADTANTDTITVTLKANAIGTAEAGAVAIPATVSVSDEDAVTATASISFNTDGTYTTGTYTNNIAGIGDYYEVYASSLVGDTVTGDSFDTWLPLSAVVGWSLNNAVAASTKTATFDVDIREIADVLNTGTVSVTLEAIVS